MKMRCLLVMALCVGVVGAPVSLRAQGVAPAITQPITTAEGFLDSIAQLYGEISDYTADIAITQEQSVARGALSYLAPRKIRIDFSVPAEQVLVSDGRDLWIYLPSQSVVLQQSARETGAGLASGEGLALLRRNYSASFLSSPSPTPISGTNERGVHLKLVWRNSNEHFRELVIAVNDEGHIRMIRGITARNQTIRFDFTNIQVNQGVPEARFDYDPPASANLYTDFLFSQ